MKFVRICNHGGTNKQSAMAVDRIQGMARVLDWKPQVIKRAVICKGTHE